MYDDISQNDASYPLLQATVGAAYRSEHRKALCWRDSARVSRAALPLRNDSNIPQNLTPPPSEPEGVVTVFSVQAFKGHSFSAWRPFDAKELDLLRNWVLRCGRSSIYTTKSGSLLVSAACLSFGLWWPPAMKMKKASWENWSIGRVVMPKSFLTSRLLEIKERYGKVLKGLGLGHLLSGHQALFDGQQISCCNE